MSRLSRNASQGRTGSPPLHQPPGRRPLSFSPRPRWALNMTPVLVLGPHPMMHLCIDTWCNGLGRREAKRALGRAEPHGDPNTLTYRQPAQEPALCHQGSPVVAGEGWGACSCDPTWH